MFWEEPSKKQQIEDMFKRPGLEEKDFKALTGFNSYAAEIDFELVQASTLIFKKYIDENNYLYDDHIHFQLHILDDNNAMIIVYDSSNTYGISYIYSSDQFPAMNITKDNNGGREIFQNQLEMPSDERSFLAGAISRFCYHILFIAYKTQKKNEYIPPHF